MQRATIHDVAAASGTSVATVSKALRGKPGMTETVRARIVAIAADLNYRPNHAARGLPVGRSHLIGYCLPADPTTASMTVFMAGLVTGATRRGYEILLFARLHGQSAAEAYRELLGRCDVDGFVLADVDLVDPRPTLLRELDKPFVSFGRLEEDPAPYVDSDVGAAMSQIMEHLRIRGHKQIAFVGWRSGSAAGLRRWDAFDVAAGGAGDEGLDVAYVEVERSSWDAGFEAWTALQSAPPTAVVCASDDLALGVSESVARSGRSVGVNVAVVGFDDIEYARHAPVPLTTIRQDLFAIGDLCAAKLVQLIETPSDPPAPSYIPCGLIARQSSLGQVAQQS